MFRKKKNQKYIDFDLNGFHKRLSKFESTIKKYCNQVRFRLTKLKEANVRLMVKPQLKISQMALIQNLTCFIKFFVRKKVKLNSKNLAFNLHVESLKAVIIIVNTILLFLI